MTPKMQLSPGDYVSPPFRTEINKWLIDFFGYVEEAEPVLSSMQFNDANLQPATPKKSKTKTKATRAKKTQTSPGMKSLSALLEGLEDSFHSLQVPTLPGSHLTRAEVSSIKKLGVYVPTDFHIDFLTEPLVPSGTALPMIASALLVTSREERALNQTNEVEDKLYPRFIYALKGVSLPPKVEAVKGKPYQIGMCYELKHDEHDKEMKPKMFWMWCWAVIRPDGSIKIPHELRPMASVVKHKRALPARGKSSSHSSVVHFNQWCIPTAARADVGGDQETFDLYLRSLFVRLITWWADRDQQWSVGVRKDGHRVTFNIAKEHTSAYFADRDTVVNVNGKPKKIVHFVRQHTRVTGATVKEHVRGLREFDWKGYHCTVVAPNLKGRVFTNCPLDPVLVPAAEQPGFMTPVELANRLASLEDTV